MSEPTYHIRSNLVKKLRKKSGKTWAEIYTACFVDEGTVKRWLAGTQKTSMDSIQRLATALGTTADQIILQDGEVDLTDYVDGEIKKEGNRSDFKEPEDITAILEDTQKRIGSRYRVMLMYVGDGSIVIGIKIHRSDLIRLIKAFLSGRLDHLKIKSITVGEASFAKPKAQETVAAGSVAVSEAQQSYDAIIWMAKQHQLPEEDAKHIAENAIRRAALYLQSGLTVYAGKTKALLCDLALRAIYDYFHDPQDAANIGEEWDPMHDAAETAKGLHPPETLINPPAAQKDEAAHSTDQPSKPDKP